MNKKGKIPALSWQAMFFAYMIFAMNANGRELINRVSPYIIDTFHITADQVGLIGTVSAIGMVIGAIPLSRWVEKGMHGAGLKKRVCFIAGGYLLFMLLCGISPICGTFAMLLIFQGLRGLFSSPGENGEVNTAVEWWPKEKNGLALGFHHTAYPWGTAIGGFVVSALLGVLGNRHWQLVFLIFPIVGLIVMLGFWKFSTPERYSRLEKEIEENGMTPPLKSVERENGANVQPMPVSQVLKIPKVWTTAIIGFCCQFSYIGLMFWMPLYLAYVAGFSYSAAAGLSVVYAITGGLGQIFWGHFSDRKGVRLTLTICFIWLTVMFFLMKFISNGIGWVIVLQLLIGFCSNAVYPVMYKRGQDAVPDNANVSATSIITTGIFIGAACATYVTGWLIRLGGGFESVSGYNTGLIAMGVVMIIALVVLLVSEGLDKNKTEAIEK